MSILAHLQREKNILRRTHISALLFQGTGENMPYYMQASSPYIQSHSFGCLSFQWTTGYELSEIQHAQTGIIQTTVRHQLLLSHLENGHFSFYRLHVLLDLSAFHPLQLMKKTGIFPCNHGKVTCCKLQRENWLQLLNVSTSTHSPHLRN